MLVERSILENKVRRPLSAVPFTSFALGVSHGSKQDQSASPDFRCATITILIELSGLDFHLLHTTLPKADLIP